MAVEAWIHGHQPDPWLEANIKILNKMIARLVNPHQEVEVNSELRLH